MNVMEDDAHFSLPYVDQIDFDRILLDEITDVGHRKRWRHLVRTNPELAREILRYAITDAREVSSEEDFVHREISLATFVLQAVGSALERTQAPAESPNN